MKARLSLWTCGGFALLLSTCAAEDGRLYKTPAPLIGMWVTADFRSSVDQVSPEKGSVLYIDEHGHGVMSFRQNLGNDFEVSGYRRSTGTVTFLNYPRARLMGPGYLEPCVSFVFAYDPKEKALKFLTLTGTGQGIPPNVSPQPGQIYRKVQSKRPVDWSKIPHYASPVT